MDFPCSGALGAGEYLVHGSHIPAELQLSLLGQSTSVVHGVQSVCSEVVDWSKLFSSMMVKPGICWLLLWVQDEKLHMVL